MRDGLRAIAELEDDIVVVGEAMNGREAVTATRQLRPDVVLMDVQMPEFDGIEATRRLVTVSDSPRIVMLTTFDRDEYLYEAMRAGASGFLLKDMRRGQLVEAIRTVARGDALVAPTITRRLIEELCRRPANTGRLPEAYAGLTPRELQVLELLARGHSNSEIALTLIVAETTIKTHVARILQKLQLRDRVQAVIHAYESGLVAPGHS